jgi:hypothetical protein
MPLNKIFMTKNCVLACFVMRKKRLVYADYHPQKLYVLIYLSKNKYLYLVI